MWEDGLWCPHSEDYVSTENMKLPACIMVQQQFTVTHIEALVYRYSNINYRLLFAPTVCAQMPVFSSPLQKTAGRGEEGLLSLATACSWLPDLSATQPDI